jgi:hypothetical protein
LAKQAREEIKWSQHKHFGAELVLKSFKDLLSNLSKFYQESKFRKDKQQALAIVVYGGFHLVDLIITELKGHMTCLSALIGGKFICKKKFFTRSALHSELCNFNQ